MPGLPNDPIATDDTYDEAIVISQPGSDAQSDLPAPQWPSLARILITDRVGPTAANKQHKVLQKRTISIAQVVNLLARGYNEIDNNYLRRDGSEQKDEVAGITGDMPFNGNKAVSLGAGSDPTDGVNMAQLNAVADLIEDVEDLINAQSGPVWHVKTTNGAIAIPAGAKRVKGFGVGAGGGGGGGGLTLGSGDGSGGGGGGGASGELKPFDLTIDDSGTLTATIGTGGSPGTTAGDGGDGGDTTLAYTGTGGPVSSTAQGGNGGKGGARANPSGHGGNGGATNGGKPGGTGGTTAQDGGDGRGYAGGADPAQCPGAGGGAGNVGGLPGNGGEVIPPNFAGDLDGSPSQPGGPSTTSGAMGGGGGPGGLLAPPPEVPRDLWSGVALARGGYEGGNGGDGAGENNGSGDFDATVGDDGIWPGQGGGGGGGGADAPGDPTASPGQPGGDGANGAIFYYFYPNAP